jgi:hypothetical protein
LEIELPDGTILEAPDDADASAVAKSYLRNQRVAALKKSNPGEYDPTSKEWQAKYGPTAGMSGTQKFLAGAGKAVADTGRGLKQIGLEIAQPFRSNDVTSLVTGENQAERYRREMDEVKRLDAPLMKTGAGLAGNIGGHVATTMLPAAGLSKLGQAANLPKLVTGANAFINPSSIRGAAAAGAALGAIQPVGTDDSRIANAALGGATGGLVQGTVNAIGRIAQPIKRSLSAVDEKAVKTLESAGVPLDAAQKSGSQRAMQVKRFLTDNPVTAAGQVAQAEKTAAGFTRAALREIGENADIADEQVLGRAASRIGGEFDRIATANPIKADNKLLNDLVAVQQGAFKELESSPAQVVSNQVDEVLAKVNGGHIDGKAYQSIKSTLDRISNGSNPQLGYWARQLRETLDDALQRSAKPGDFDALKLARKQYGSLDKIIKSVNPDGYVSPKKLYNASNVKSYGQKKAMATGKGQTQLQKLAKAGSRVIPERMPNSGTTPRALLQATLPAVAGGAYGATQGGDAGDIAKFAAMGAGAPLAARYLLNNPRASNYLAYGLQGPMRNVLLSAPNTLPGLVTRQVPAAGLLALQSQQ